MQAGSSPNPPQALQPPSSHYENFPVASVLCPPRLRPAIAAIYWFARTADDIADEGDARPAQRLQDLAAIRDDLFAAAEGRPGSGRWSPVFDALQPVIAEFDLPVGLLADLLSAFEQDVVKQRYATEAELLDYCRRSANPVGRLLLHLYGVHDVAPTLVASRTTLPPEGAHSPRGGPSANANALAQSDSICTALQLINFWQDLSVDIPRGRIYLPRELWAVHGVDEAQLMAGQANPATTKLIAACARAARASMQKGLHLPATVARHVGGFDGWRAALELRCVIQGGLRILDKMEAMDHQTLAQRPKLGAWDAVVIFWKALFA